MGSILTVQQFVLEPEIYINYCFIKYSGLNGPTEDTLLLLKHLDVYINGSLILHNVIFFGIILMKFVDGFV